MSEFTGDGQADAGSGPQIIKLGPVAGAVGSEAGAPGGSSPPGRDPFAPSRYRFTRRRAIAFGVLLALALGSWACYQRGSQWWQQRSQDREIARHDVAVTQAVPLLAGYTFPASITRGGAGAMCSLGGVACGTTNLAPEAAVAVIAPTLIARGFELTDGPRDQCAARGQRFERCAPGLALRGVPVGSLSIQRDNFQARTFGSLTEVAVHLSQPSTAQDGYVGPPVAVSVTSPAKLDLVPPDLAALARCTKTAAAGCLSYEVRTTLRGSTLEAMARVGRYAVAHGWAVSGYCPGGSQGHCDLYVSRRSGTHFMDRVGMLGAFDPVAGGTRVVLTFDATKVTTTG